MRLTAEQFEEHQRRHGFAKLQQAVVPAPMEPAVASKAELKAERDIQSDVTNYLTLHEIVFDQAPWGKKSRKRIGWPDLTFSYRPAGQRYGIPVAMEVKTATGKLSPDQRALHPKLALNGWRVVVVRSVADVQALFREIDAEAAAP